MYTPSRSERSIWCDDGYPLLQFLCFAIWYELPQPPTQCIQQWATGPSKPTVSFNAVPYTLQDKNIHGIQFSDMAQIGQIQIRILIFEFQLYEPSLKDF